MARLIQMEMVELEGSSPGVVVDWPLYLEGFESEGGRTLCTTCGVTGLPVFTNSFWTARQRQASRLHEVSYRACFKPALPRFFIEGMTTVGMRVFDPFLGRGTTVIEAALMGRRVGGCDINPLSQILVRPRLRPPGIGEVAARLEEMELGLGVEVGMPEEMLVFYHPEVLAKLMRLREWIVEREVAGGLDEVDEWIRMVATNRLTGHSAGFFSVYTMPPNQAVSLASQRRINAKRGQAAVVRDVEQLILRKSRSLLSGVTEEEKVDLRVAAGDAMLVTASSEAMELVSSDSVDLVVTSPPFLNEVDYRTDNWLRAWFNGIDVESMPIWQVRSLAVWQERMTAVMGELERIVRPGGWIVFEVGEVRKGTVRLEEAVVPAMREAGLDPQWILINQQDFTKTSNCWGVDNASKGTNTNRIVVARKR